MNKRSKRYKEAAKGLDPEKSYTLTEAVNTLKKFPTAKFDESVQLNFQLGIKPDQADQTVRGTAALPHGTGKKVRVLCFVKGEAEKIAREAGAEYAGSDEFIKKIEGGWLDFDAVVAHPDMMREISKLGKVLGPRGLMPSPKAGTVTTDVKKAIKEIKAGRVEFKNDRTGGLHVLCGKRSFSEGALLENAKTLVKAVLDAKPQTTKGDYLRSVILASTQSPGLKIRSSALSIVEK